MRLLLDEMYPAALAGALRTAGIETVTVGELGLAGSSDDAVLDAAAAGDYVLLTENVADFARISADRLTAGRHHSGLLIALSSRFSRRPGGRARIVAAVAKVQPVRLEDRVLYLEA